MAPLSDEERLPPPDWYFETRDRINRLVAQANRPDLAFSEVQIQGYDGSFGIGVGPNPNPEVAGALLSASRNLLDSASDDELYWVLCHEMAHVEQGLETLIDANKQYATALAGRVSPEAASLIAREVHWKLEYAADRRAIEMGADPRAGARFLRKADRMAERMGLGGPDDLHPPTRDRVARLHRLAGPRVQLSSLPFSRTVQPSRSFDGLG